MATTAGRFSADKPGKKKVVESQRFIVLAQRTYKSPSKFQHIRHSDKSWLGATLAGLLNLHSQRMYRLTSLNGDPHPVLDDVYESFDSAWTDASSWWQNHGHTEQEPIPIGVEVSTRSGSWRTLQYPCQQEGRAVLFPQRPIPTKRHKA
jgi:hypothetical protein